MQVLINTEATSLQLQNVLDWHNENLLIQERNQGRYRNPKAIERHKGTIEALEDELKERALRHG